METVTIIAIYRVAQKKKLNNYQKSSLNRNNNRK